jgi:hypothetical protein
VFRISKSIVAAASVQSRGDSKEAIGDALHGGNDHDNVSRLGVCKYKP